MKVVTLDSVSFAEACRNLEIKTLDYAPDLIVGIESGGWYVANKMFEGVAHTSVTCRRPSTSRKGNKMLRRIISILPRLVNDWLRMAESILLERFESSERKVEIGSETKDSIRNARRILVVDDSVDSGATLTAVVNTLKSILRKNDIELRTCAVTVTTANPMIRPDYCLYADKTLIRFPWSMDSGDTIENEQ